MINVNLEINENKLVIMTMTGVDAKTNEIEKLLVLKNALDNTLFHYEKDYQVNADKDKIDTVITLEEISKLHKKQS